MSTGVSFRGNAMQGVSDTYRYAAVEAAIATVFFIEPKSMGAFRGRITNLRKFGLTPSAPKKGAPVEYAFADVAKLAFCLSLIEIGLDPASVDSIFFMSANGVMPSLLEDEPEDMIFCFHGNAMSRTFAGNMGRKAHLTSVVLPASVASYEEVTRKFTPSHLDLADPDMRSLGSRLCMVNLSHIRRELLSALK